MKALTTKTPPPLFVTICFTILMLGCVPYHRNKDTILLDTIYSTYELRFGECRFYTLEGNIEFINFGPCLRNSLKRMLPAYFNDAMNGSSLTLEEFQNRFQLSCVAARVDEFLCVRRLQVQLVSRIQDAGTLWLRAGPELRIQISLDVEMKLDGSLVVKSATVAIL